MAVQAGDYVNSKSQSPSKLLASADCTELDFSAPLLMETQIRVLKNTLEGWRAVVLPLREIFLWERQWHPTAILTGTTIWFTLLWILDPSILTVLALSGLILTIADYVLPSLVASLSKKEPITAREERDLENLCTDLVLFKTKIELTVASFYELRSSNKKKYYTISILVLSFLVWIGCTFNNLFVSYVIINIALLYPGMEQHGIIAKWSDNLRTVFANVVQQAKAKVTQEKKEE